MRHWRGALLLVGLVLACWGCGQSSPVADAAPAAAGPRDVDVVDLAVTPTPVDFDGEVGGDGLVARVMFFQRRQAKAIALTRGQLVFSLYAGSVGPARLAGEPALQTWTFDAATLRGRGRLTAVGYSYGFALPWRDGVMPAVTLVTLAARYEPPGGEALWSRPTTISLVAR